MVFLCLSLPALVLADAAQYGKVISFQTSDGYLYIEVEKDGRREWLVSNPTTISAGDWVSWMPSKKMAGFKAKSFNRTFDEILFVDQLTVVADPATVRAIVEENPPVSAFLTGGNAHVLKYEVQDLKIGMSPEVVMDRLPFAKLQEEKFGYKTLKMEETKGSQLSKGMLYTSYKGTFYRKYLTEIEYRRTADRLDCSDIKAKIESKYGAGKSYTININGRMVKYTSKLTMQNVGAGKMVTFVDGDSTTKELPHRFTIYAECGVNPNAPDQIVMSLKSLVLEQELHALLEPKDKKPEANLPKEQKKVDKQPAKARDAIKAEEVDI